MADSENEVMERFVKLLQTFLTDRVSSFERKDLLSGVPWMCEDEGRHYFRLSDLQKFLEREGMKLPRTEITMRVTAIHENDDPMFYPHKFLRVADKGVNVWWVPL